MRITMEADYAIRIVYYLSCSGRKIEAKTIADDVCVTLGFTLKILRKLTAGRIVTSFKGVNGGYKLALAPSEITLLHVIETIDGPVGINRCLGDGEECNRTGDKGACPMHVAFGRINEVLVDKLRDITFDQFLEKI